jgi:hypothetical protein
MNREPARRALAEALGTGGGGLGTALVVLLFPHPPTPATPLAPAEPAATSTIARTAA